MSSSRVPIPARRGQDIFSRVRVNPCTLIRLKLDSQFRSSLLPSPRSYGRARSKITLDPLMDFPEVLQGCRLRSAQGILLAWALPDRVIRLPVCLGEESSGGSQRHLRRSEPSRHILPLPRPVKIIIEEAQHSPHSYLVLGKCGVSRLVQTLRLASNSPAAVTISSLFTVRKACSLPARPLPFFFCSPKHGLASASQCSPTQTPCSIDPQQA